MKNEGRLPTFMFCCLFSRYVACPYLVKENVDGHAHFLVLALLPVHRLLLGYGALTLNEISQGVTVLADVIVYFAGKAGL